MKAILILTLSAMALSVAVPVASAQVTLESAPPVVVKTDPTAGAEGVDAALNEIRVTFSKVMLDGSWSWSTWGEENYPQVTGQPRYLADGRTCVLPVKLEPGKFYAIWLNSDKFKNFTDANNVPAVPYLLTFRTAAAGAVGGGGGALIERVVDKLVSDFPAGADLSTPESACAAWQRANAGKDARAISRLSLVPLDATEEENWYRREAARDAQGLAIYLKAIADSEIVAVQVWRGELANVITYLPFPPGKGRDPFSARVFGKVNGEWKNLGEDRLPDLAAAKANFDRKKDAMWRQFAALSGKPAASTAAGQAAGPSSDAFGPLLNDDQRSVVAWTDRQFRSFFDQRTFAGWSEAERSDLEQRLLDTLKGPETREYYQAINSLGALGGTNAVSALRSIAFDRRDKNNRDRWMAIRALGLLGDKAAIPELIHLVYHGNANTHWWAQISLVRLTGRNFGSDWQAWGKWWNESGGQPPYQPEIIRWWAGQPEPDKLAESLADGDRKFLSSLQPQAVPARPAAEAEKPVAFQAPDPEPVPGLVNAVLLQRDTGIRTGMQSINGSGHAVKFARPAGARFVEAVQIFTSRYGTPEPPAEDFHLYLLNEQQQVLADVPFPYSMIERGDMKWHTLRTPSIEVPENFQVALAFNPHRTKGIYLAYTETNAAECHSLIGLPGDGFESWKAVEWMVRVSLTPEPTKAKGLQRLADWKPAVAQDPFGPCRMVALGGDRSEGKQSYGGRGPAIQFKPVELLAEARPGEPAVLKGVRVYASRYGSGYAPEEAMLRVHVLDAQGGRLAESAFPYAKFGYRERWVDLVFDQPVAIANPGELLTLAFDPAATQMKGIYFHFQKNPAASHSFAGTVGGGFTPAPDREWMMRVAFEPAAPAIRR